MSSATCADLNDRAAAVNNLPVEVVGPDDLLAISVAECPDLTKSFRVGKGGDLTLPSLKQPLSVDGLTSSGVAQRLAEQLTKQHILVQPIVSVQVVEYRSHMVTISGAVKHPGQFQVAGHKTVLDVLSEAEGVLPEAGPTLVVVSPRTKARQIISIKELLESPNATNNPVLTGGEEMQVPEAVKIYVMGNVKHPGAFPLHEAQSTSVFRILAECEGVLPFTGATAYIYRQTPGSAPQEIPVQLHALLTRKAPDVLLYGSDILYVPDQKGKRITAEVLARLAQFGSNTGSQALVFH
jgi:protein involved in polysaccharide export with SLBB domain